MEFDIIYGGNIEVRSEGRMFVYADIKNGLKTRLSFYQDSKLKLTSELSSFFIWKRIAIDFQDLSFPISYFAQDSFLRFTMCFENHVINTVQNIFKNKGWILSLDGNEVARVKSFPGITLGYSRYIMYSDSDDNTINLYLLFAFLVQYWPG